MMDDHGSKRKKKKKRGKSLIFKNFFKPATPGDDPSSGSGRKALASDDNLIYCDVSGNCVDPDIKKSSSSRMSRIFKAVLFDTAVVSLLFVQFFLSFHDRLHYRRTEEEDSWE